ncbi:MAG: hypothetical protein QN229_03630 [Desulfurococcaceae archaeon TW002]
MNLARAIILGLVIGLLQGFIDTYGYAVTGYTTAEIAGIVSAVIFLVLYRVIFRKTPSVFEHFLGIAIASGISISTTLTAGMYITYTMLNTYGDTTTLELPSWTYYVGSLSIDTLLFYLYATAVSVSGSLIAYVFYKHYIEKEKLPYPIGSSIARVVQVGKVLRKEYLALALSIGFLMQFSSMYLGGLTLDITSIMQKITPGAALALTLDVFVLTLALLIPLNTSLGIGIGNILTYLVVTPLLASLGLLISLPSLDNHALATAAAPYIASLISGFLIVASSYYVVTGRGYFKTSLKYVYSSRYLTRYLLFSALLIGSLIIPVVYLHKATVTMLLVTPIIVVLHIFLTIFTLRVAGEAGTVSQATLPLATLTLFLSGARGATPYVFLDPYTGVPMPQFVAANTLNYVKAGKTLEIRAEVSTFLLALLILLGAPITLFYGHVLLNTFGLTSPKLNLLRWVPLVMWMNNLYNGYLTSFNMHSILIGLFLAFLLIIVFRFLGLGNVSLFGILIGVTLTPDLGMLFIVASVVKYVAFRIGVDVYESLITYSSLVLAGAGLGVATSVLMSLIGVL